jgi:transcription-repair coupling factor (superfamily II helicase)
MSLDFLNDVPEFKDLVRALEKSEKGLRISGLAAPSKPFFFSSLAQRLPRRIVYIQPAEYSLTRFEERSGFFFSELGSAKHAKALPALTENPYQETAPSLEAVSSRMRLFYDLLYRMPALIITNLFGLLRPFPGPDRLARLFLRLEKNSFYDRDKLLETLAA